jgi:hypothetical protein
LLYNEKSEAEIPSRFLFDTSLNVIG